MGIPNPRPDRLRGILHNRQLADCFSQRRKINSLPKQVHDDHSASSITDNVFARRGIGAEGVRFDIHEHRGGANPDDGFRRGDKAECGDDDVVAGPDAEGDQRADEGVRSGGDGNGVGCAGVFGEGLFKSLNVGAEHIGPRPKHARHGALEVFSQRFVLAIRVSERDRRTVSHQCTSR